MTANALHYTGYCHYPDILHIFRIHLPSNVLLSTVGLTPLSFLQNSNFKASWLSPAEQTLKWLSRGLVNITVTLNTAGQSVQLIGRVGIKKTCNCESIECFVKGDKIVLIDQSNNQSIHSSLSPFFSVSMLVKSD